MVIENEVAGMRCEEVLTELSDYLDGDLPFVRRSQIEAHLHGCDVCERFGGTFLAAIRALRQEGPSQVGEESVVYERLRCRLENVTSRNSL